MTNPDMLHAAILPHHTKWFQLFEQLQVIVVDELHLYRGLFGSHVGNVLRRLLRICRHYGSTPVIVTCSATIANPGQLATRLTGRPPLIVDRNGAPSGERHVLFVDPPIIDAPSGARGSSITLAQRWALPFLRAGRQTIVFGRSRTGVELILTGLRESLREHGGPRTRVRGYRGGYLPTERRAIEDGLREGDVLGVVSTNALELGVDIGRLDVSVLAGYPGSIAATWQQIGRAGRRQDASVAILVASAAPVDQYVVHHPEFLLANPPEEARVDPDNLHVLLAHLKAAAFELPFAPGEEFGPGPADDLLAFLGEDGHVHCGDDGRWYWASPDNFPASSISLRTAAEENVVIIDTTPDRPKVIGELDLFSAQTQVHEDAIYLHESAQFHVDRLDWDERKAYVRRVDVDHYTQAELAVTLKPLDVFARADVAGGQRVHGEVMVASRATIYKKLKFVTNENLGWGKIHLPELELQTTAYWATLDGAVAGWRRAELDVALAGTGRALQAVASVLLMTDPRDLGLVAQVRSPHSVAPTIYLYEAVPGGVGLAERLWARHAELVAGAADLVAACGCQGGCPSCTGPRPLAGDGGLDAKQLVLRLLASLGYDARPEAGGGAERDQTGIAGGRPGPAARCDARRAHGARDERDGAPSASSGGNPGGPGPAPPAERCGLTARGPRGGRGARATAGCRRGREVAGRAGRARRPRGAGAHFPSPPARPPRLAARPAAGPCAPRVPRHGDDRARHGRRDACVPRGSGVVGGRPASGSSSCSARTTRTKRPFSRRSRRQSRPTHGS